VQEGKSQSEGKEASVKQTQRTGVCTKSHIVLSIAGERQRTVVGEDGEGLWDGGGCEGLARGS
jgi:hypothetical protein